MNIREKLCKELLAKNRNSSSLFEQKNSIVTEDESYKSFILKQARLNYYCLKFISSSF